MVMAQVECAIKELNYRFVTSSPGRADFLANITFKNLSAFEVC